MAEWPPHPRLPHTSGFVSYSFSPTGDGRIEGPALSVVYRFVSSQTDAEEEVDELRSEYGGGFAARRYRVTSWRGADDKGACVYSRRRGPDRCLVHLGSVVIEVQSQLRLIDHPGEPSVRRVMRKALAHYRRVAAAS